MAAYDCRSRAAIILFQMAKAAYDRLGWAWLASCPETCPTLAVPFLLGRSRSSALSTPVRLLFRTDSLGMSSFPLLRSWTARVLRARSFVAFSRIPSFVKLSSIYFVLSRTASILGRLRAFVLDGFLHQRRRLQPFNLARSRRVFP